jgi:hypothetical protein
VSFDFKVQIHFGIPQFYNGIIEPTLIANEWRKKFIENVFNSFCQPWIVEFHDLQISNLFQFFSAI